jgi:phenylpyruvate tautomerase PptA (4-oxalocrotonate tautomerase family)
MIYKSLQLGKPVMQKLILNNSIDEEEKSVIHKLNQVIAMFLNTGRNQIWIILIRSYHLQKTKIAKVVINQMQTDNINMKQKIDIMKS